MAEQQLRRDNEIKDAEHQAIIDKFEIEHAKTRLYISVLNVCLVLVPLVAAAIAIFLQQH